MVVVGLDVVEFVRTDVVGVTTGGLDVVNGIGELLVDGQMLAVTVTVN